MVKIPVNTRNVPYLPRSKEISTIYNNSRIMANKVKYYPNVSPFVSPGKNRWGNKLKICKNE
jgi:hypothetical protein